MITESNFSAPKSDIQQMLIDKLVEVGNLLLEKNTAYGDSAFNPGVLFNDVKPSIAIKARINDKLARIQNVGINDATEDTCMDLVGYLVILMVQLEREKSEKSN